ncbi:unnamed protein product [Prunus armeniaca]
MSDQPLSGKEEEEHVQEQKFLERVRKIHTEVEAQLNVPSNNIKFAMISIMCHVTSKKVI